MAPFWRALLDRPLRRRGFRDRNRCRSRRRGRLDRHLLHRTRTHRHAPAGPEPEEDQQSDHRRGARHQKRHPADPAPGLGYRRQHRPPHGADLVRGQPGIAFGGIAVAEDLSQQIIPVVFHLRSSSAARLSSRPASSRRAANRCQRTVTSAIRQQADHLAHRQISAHFVKHGHRPAAGREAVEGGLHRGPGHQGLLHSAQGFFPAVRERRGPGFSPRPAGSGPGRD